MKNSQELKVESECLIRLIILFTFSFLIQYFWSLVRLIRQNQIMICPKCVVYFVKDMKRVFYKSAFIFLEVRYQRYCSRCKITNRVLTR